MSEGSPADFEDAVANSRAALMAGAIKLTHNPADAEDLVQSTLLRALSIKRRPVKAVRPWLLAIQRNLWLEWNRSRKPLDALDLIPEAATAQDSQGRRYRFAHDPPRPLSLL